MHDSIRSLINNHQLIGVNNYDFRNPEQPTTITVNNAPYTSLNGINAALKDCQFDTLIINSGIWSTLAFDNVTCTTLIFNNARLNTLHFKAVISKKIEIHDVKFSEFTCLASTIEEMKLNDTSRENSFVTIDNSAIRHFDFGGLQKRNNINFIKATIENLNLYSQTQNLVIKQSSEFRNIQYGKIKCQNIAIEDSNIYSRLVINDADEPINLNFNKGSVQGGIEIESAGSSISLNEVRLNGSLAIKTKSLVINLINCPYIESFETSTRLGHQQHVNISNVEFGTLTLLEATSNINLKNVKIKNQIAFNETTLTDKANFDRVYLDECVIKFHDSSITQAKFHTIRWPKNYQIDEIITKEDTNKLSLLWHKREAYRQFKVVSLSFQNKIDARQFLKNEVRMHYRYVKEVLREKIRTTKWKNVLASKELGDYLILGSNRLLSNFGESLARPLFGLLVSTLILFLIAIWEKNIDLGIKFNLQHAELEATLKGIGVYLNMLSPVHSTEVANVYAPGIKYSITGISDFFMRILAGYFIFYFVRATRKFNFDI